MASIGLNIKRSTGTPYTKKHYSDASKKPVFGFSDAGWRLNLLISTIALSAVSWAWSAGIQSTSLASTCRAWPNPIVFGPITDVALRARHNASCPIFLQRTAVTVDRLRVTVNPRNGTVIPRGNSGLIYRPNPGFKGQDYFAFSTRVMLLNYPNISEVRVRVTVN